MRYQFRGKGDLIRAVGKVRFISPFFLQKNEELLTDMSRY